MRRVAISALGVFSLVAASSVACVDSSRAQSPAVQRGQTFVRINCSRCHSIDKTSPSPLRIAPPFRNLHLKYPVETLEEALAEGIVIGHPAMPEFRLDPGQVGDVIAFLKSLEH